VILFLCINVYLMFIFSVHSVLCWLERVNVKVSLRNCKRHKLIFPSAGFLSGFADGVGVRCYRAGFQLFKTYLSLSVVSVSFEYNC